jgi:hypothetical protein
MAECGHSHEHFTSGRVISRYLLQLCDGKEANIVQDLDVLVRNMRREHKIRGIYLLLFNGAVCGSDYIVSNSRMQRMWKKVIMA